MNIYFTCTEHMLMHINVPLFDVWYLFFEDSNLWSVASHASSVNKCLALAIVTVMHTWHDEMAPQAAVNNLQILWKANKNILK